MTMNSSITVKMSSKFIAYASVQQALPDTDGLSRRHDHRYVEPQVRQHRSHWSVEEVDVLVWPVLFST